MIEIIAAFGGILRENLQYVSIGMVATALSIYGIYLKRGVKKATKDMHFVLRFVFYVVIFAFGLGFLSANAVMIIERLLRGLSDGNLALSVIAVFLTLCILAKNEKQI